MLFLKLIKHLLFIQFLFIFEINAQNIIKTLNQKLFGNYDAHTRPVKYASNITNICAGLYLLQISGVKERNQVMQANIQFVFIWSDSFLKWDPVEYENVTAIQVRAHTIWTPDIIILNSADGQITRDNRDNFLLRVTSTGTVRWQFQTLSSSFCQIDIIAFPFDEQTCYINIRSSARNKHMLNLKQRNMKVKVKENIRTEWFVVDSSVENTTLILVDEYLRSEYTVLSFKLRIRRVITYYVFKIIVPFSMIAFTSLFAFWLAPDSGEKITLEVTILLSLVIYLQYISEYIPRSTTGLPMLTIFTLTNFFLVFLSCIVTVFVLRLYHPPATLSQKTKRMPNTLRVFFFKYLAALVCYKSHRQSNLNDDKIIEIKTKSSDQKQVNVNENVNDKCSVSLNPTTNATTTTTISAAKHEKLARNILSTLKSLKKIIAIDKNLAVTTTTTTNNGSSYSKQCYNNIYNRSESTSLSLSSPSHSSPSSYSAAFTNNDKENNICREEWKQAALILDRFFFYLFLIIMPLTITVFFKTNVFEYIISNKFTKRDDNVPNINGC